MMLTLSFFRVNQLPHFEARSLPECAGPSLQGTGPRGPYLAAILPEKMRTYAASTVTLPATVTTTRT